MAEELLLRTLEDIDSIRRVLQITPSSLTLCVAPSWKMAIFSAVATAKDRNTVLREIMKVDQMRKRGKEAMETTKQCITLVHRLPPAFVEQFLNGRVKEMEIFRNARDFLERECAIPVRVVDALESRHPRAATALPLKPAIIIE